MSTTALSPVVIQVRFDRVYGNVVCYPANDAAKHLAAIAGTKTLSRETLRLIGLLGHIISATDNGAGTLAVWLGEYLTC